MIGKLHFNEQQHAMLLNSADEHDVATRYVNEALSRGYLTIYLPINGNNNNNNNNNNPSHLSKIALSNSIINYEENVNRGNLLTFDTRVFYNFALAGDLQPFEDLKVLIEEAIQERIASSSSKRTSNDEEEEIVLVVAEVAAELIRNKKFDESLKVEEWWQKTHSEWLQKGLKVTIICPHSSAMLDNGEFMHYKQSISSLHEIIVESGSVFAEQKNTEV
jgi:hypothetical protein